MQHCHDGCERLLSVVDCLARCLNSSGSGMSLRTLFCIFQDRLWATAAVGAGSKACMEEEEVVVLGEGCRSAAMPPPQVILYNRPLGKSPCIPCYKLPDMQMVVPPPPGMLGVELVLDMEVAEEGKKRGCRPVEEVGVGEVEVVEEVVEGEEEREDCCELQGEGGYNTHPGMLVCRNAHSKRGMSSLRSNNGQDKSRHNTIRTCQGRVH